MKRILAGVAAIVAGLAGTARAADLELQYTDNVADSAVVAIGVVDARNAFAFGLQKQQGSDNASPVKLSTSDGGGNWAVGAGGGHTPSAIVTFSGLKCFPSGKCFGLGSSIDMSAGIDMRTAVASSQDGGKTWFWPTGTQLKGRSFSSLDLVSETEMWVCNGDSTIMHSVDGAKTFQWKVPQIGDTKYMKIQQISFVDGQVGWALNQDVKQDDKGVETIGSEGALLKTTDGGTTWTALFTGTSDAYDQLEMVSATKGWLRGHTAAGPFLRRTSDGGQTWQDVAIPQPAFQVNGSPAPAVKYLDAFVAFDAEDGMLVASAPYGDNQAVHVVFRVVGGTLQELAPDPMQNVGSLVALACADRSTCWVGGQYLSLIRFRDESVVPGEDTGGASDTAGTDTAGTDRGGAPDAAEGEIPEGGICVPGSRMCDGAIVRECSANGKSWAWVTNCAEAGQSCSGQGVCGDATKKSSGCAAGTVPAPAVAGLLAGFLGLLAARRRRD